MDATKHIRSRGRAVLYLVLAGVGAASSICGAGWLRYDASWRLSVERGRIEHSQDILSSFQSESQRLDRIEPALELYKLTGDEVRLRMAQADSAALHSSALEIERLVVDNPSQTQYAQRLTEQSASLMQSVNALTQKSALPTQEIIACRESIGALLGQEQELLRERTQQANTQSIRSTALSIRATGFSLIVVIVLISLLIRDALQRHQYQAELSNANGKLSGMVRVLERQAREAELLSEARDELQFCTTSEQAEQSAARFLERLLPGTRGAVCLINQSRRMVEIAAGWNRLVSLADGFTVESCCGLRSGQERRRKPGQSEVHCTHFASTPPENYVCLPLAAHGETLGIVYVECPSSGIAAMVDEQAAGLREMVEMASMSIAGLNLRNRLVQQSIRDNLTGLYNRHFMEEALEREIRRAARHQKRVAMLMADVDFFKQFNDDFGHEAGDMVLRHAADALTQALRGDDVLCRYGGEEFLAILPEITLDDAMARAEELRQTVSKMRLQFHGTELPKVTVSVGVAAYPQHAASGEQLLRAADRALYAAKRQGRNQVAANDQVTVV